MADIPSKLEWDGRQWIPFSGAPNRSTAEWNPYVGNWDVKKPDDNPSALLGMLPASVERGVRSNQERNNELLNIIGLQSDQDTASRIAQLERRKQDIAPPPEIQKALSDISNAETLGDAVKTAMTNPQAILSVVGESLGTLAPDLIGGVGVGGVAAKGAKIAIPFLARRLALGMGMGLSSGTIEATSTVLDQLNQQGVPLTDETALLTAMTDPNMMGPIKERALARGIPVGAFDALSAGAAGKLFDVLGGMTEGAGAARRLGAAAGELAGQGATGAAGEAAGQLSADKKITSPGDIMMEGVAEVAGAPLEAYAALRGHGAHPSEHTNTPTPEAVAQAHKLITGLGYDPSQFGSDIELVTGAQQLLADLDQQRAQGNASINAQTTAAAERIKQENARIRQQSAQDNANASLNTQETQQALEGQQGLAAAQITAENARLAQVEAQQRVNDQLRAQDSLQEQAAGPKLLAPPSPETRSTDLGHLTDSQIDEHLAANQHVPRIADILAAEIPVEHKRTLGLEALKDMGPANAAVTNPETNLTEGVNRLLPYATEQGASEEQARGETDRIRKQLKKAKVGDPVPELTPGLTSQFNDEGLIRPHPEGEGYVRASEPRQLPDVLTRDTYRALEDHIAGKEQGEKVTIPDVRQVTGLKSPAEARTALDYFKQLGLLEDGGKGKPPVVASPARETAVPELAETTEVPNLPQQPGAQEQVQQIAQQIAGPEAAAHMAPQSFLDAWVGPTSGGGASNNTMVVSNNVPASDRPYVAAHEATHVLLHLGKLAQNEAGALLSPKGQVALKKIIDWGRENGHSTSTMKNLDQTIADTSPMLNATRGQVEAIALAAETEQFRQDNKLRYPFEPGGLIRRALRKIVDFMRRRASNEPEAANLVKQIVEGKFANRVPDTGPRMGAADLPPPKSTSPIAPAQREISLDAEAAADTKALPETATEYAARATYGLRETQVFQQTDPLRKPLARPIAKGKVVAPPGQDTPVFMNWFNWHVNSLGYNAARHKELRPYARAVEHYDRLSANMRRRFQDQVMEIFNLNQADTDKLTNYMVVRDSLGMNAREIINQDGSKTLRWKPEDETTPLPKFLQTGEVTISGKLAEQEGKARTAFDSFHKEMINSMLARYGIEPNTTSATLKDRAQSMEGQDKDNLLNLAYLLDQSYGYHQNYFPHDRPFTPTTVRFTVGKEGETPQVYHIDSPYNRASSIRRAQSLQTELQKSLPPSEGYKYSSISPLTSSEFVNSLSGEEAADAVQTLGNIVLKGDNRMFTDENGNQVSATDLFMRALTKVRTEAGKQGFARRTRQRKNVAGYFHEGNAKTYLKSTMSDYFMRGSEWLAGAYTAKERADSIGALRKQPDLMNYALEREKYIASPGGLQDKLRAIAFHWALGFNFSSAILNGFQALHTTFPYLSQMSSVHAAGPQIIRAYRDASRLLQLTGDPDKVFRLDTKPKWMAQDEFDLLKLARSEGITEPLMTTEYAGGIAGKFSSPKPMVGGTEHILSQLERSGGVGMRKVAALSSSMFSTVEQANRIAAVLAAYRLAKDDPKVQANMRKWVEAAGTGNSENMSVPELALLAAQETQYNMTKANRPLFLQGIGGVVFQFSQYPIYTMELMLKSGSMLGGKGFWKSTDGKKMLGLMLMGIWSTAGLMGLPVLSQLANGIDAAGDALAPLAGMNPPEFKEAIREFMIDFTRDQLGVDDPVGWTNTIMKGGFRQVTGLSVEQRTALDWPNTSMLSGNLLDAVGPFGSLIGGGIKDAAGYLSQGNNTLAIASVMPLAVRNAVKAKMSETQGLPNSTTGNSPVLPGELGLGKRIALSVGFTPSELADIREAARQVKNGGEGAKDAFAARMANPLGEMLVAQEKGDQKTADAKYKEFQALIDKVVDHDLSQKDPADMIAPDFEKFYKDRVLPRMMRNYVEGPFGATAMKKIPQDQRGQVAEKIKEYYGKGP